MIHINSFVRRQTESSPFTHWTISDEELIQRIESGMPNSKPGYRDGVILVPIRPAFFYTGIVTLLPGYILKGSYVARKEGEEPRKQVNAIGNKTSALTVWVVLYRNDVLAENDENETDAEWEIVSINGSPTEDTDPAPMPPETLIANHFQLSGGTGTKMTPEQFEKALKESVLYWKDKAMVVAS